MTMKTDGEYFVRKLRDLIPTQPVLQQRFDDLGLFEQGLLLGSMARIDGTPLDRMCYYPEQNQIWIHSFCDTDLIASLSLVMKFFRDAFPEPEEHNEEQQ